MVGSEEHGAGCLARATSMRTELLCNALACQPRLKREPVSWVLCEPGGLRPGRPGGGKLLYRVATLEPSASISQSV